MNVLEIILGVLGAILALLFGRKLLGRGSPAAPAQGATEQVRAAERLAEAARTGAARAAQAREAADDAAIQEVGSRPHTDDAVADLEARLGGTRPIRPVGWIGYGSHKPPTPGNGQDR